MAKFKCKLDQSDFIEVSFDKDEDGEVRFEIVGVNFVRLTPRDALRLSKKLKNHARKYIPKEATIS